MNVHARNLDIAVQLSRFVKKDMISPVRIMSVLGRRNVSAVLVGLYGIVGWLEKPRQCLKPTVIVARRHLKRAETAIAELRQRWMTTWTESAVQFSDEQHPEFRLTLMAASDKRRSVFRNTVSVRAARTNYRIPSLEMTLVLTAESLVDRTRWDAAKYMDAHDFMVIVKMNR